ncbi:MAG: YbaK/EbsC family protein [Sulfolobaceae archaeon]|nr:YbaK/EbsC family protein [Sulfolobaceae archaeon]
MDNKLEEELKSLNITYRFVRVKDARTVKSASESLGVSEDRIAKTVIVIADGKPYAVFIRGNKKVNLDSVKNFLKVKEVRMAKASEVKRLTGYEVGGVPPIIPDIETIMDEDLAIDENGVYCGGGDDKTLLYIIPKELKEKIGIRVFKND